MRQGRERPLRCGGRAGLSGWFRATVLLVFQETGSAGVCVSLFSDSSAPPPPTPASLVLLPSFAPLSPQVPTLAHPFLTLSRQEARRRNTLSSKLSLLPRNLLCVFFFFFKYCSDYAADSRARLGRPWGKLQPRSSLPNSALWRRKPHHSLSPYPSHISHQSFSIQSVQRGCSSSGPLSPFSC